MQLLFEARSSTRAPRASACCPAGIVRLDADGLKLPHIGWNGVRWTRSSPLLAGIPAPAAFYHVHSFVPDPAPEDDDVVLGEGDYGGRFVSFVERGTVFGAQCHPEKSSVHGLRLLENFVKVAERARDPLPSH
jgi:glutamine amidotransferase